MRNHCFRNPSLESHGKLVLSHLLKISVRFWLDSIQRLSCSAAKEAARVAMKEGRKKKIRNRKSEIHVYKIVNRFLISNFDSRFNRRRKKKTFLSRSKRRKKLIFFMALNLGFYILSMEKNEIMLCSCDCERREKY